MDNKILDVFELYAEADKKKVDAFNKKLSSKMEIRLESDKPKYEALWIDMMENTLEYIDNVLHAPTRLIINEEEVINIEKIKKVSVESIKHLSSHANFIDDVDENGDVQPGKLLNVFKEESLNTYENRFIYTLIIRMLTLINKEKRKLLAQTKTPTKEMRTFDYTGSVHNGKMRVDAQFVVTSTSESSGLPDDKKEQLERIKNLEKNVRNLTLTTTYVTLEKEKVPMITPPLKKTNALLKNVNFQYAVKLWDFLIDEMEKEKPPESQTYQKKYKDRGKVKKYIDDTFLLDYLVLDAAENPDVTDKYKKALIEQLVANMVERTIDVNESLTEEQLKNLVSKQFTVIKYKRQVSNKELQDIFKKYIGKYVRQISEN